MNPDDVTKLKMKLRDEVVARPPGAKVAIIGWTPAAIELAADPVFSIGAALLLGIFLPGKPMVQASVKPLEALAADQPDIVVIADDGGKESLLEAAAAILPAETKLLIGGGCAFQLSR